MYGFSTSTTQKNEKYGFVDEHETRIAAGITFVLGFYALIHVLLLGEYSVPLGILSILWIDFILKVAFGPQYSIFGGMARLFLRKRKPEWVGAMQKRFAWSMGLVFSTLVLVCLWILSKLPTGPVAPTPQSMGGFSHEHHAQVMANLAQSDALLAQVISLGLTPPIILCIICLSFMWLEAVAGYCVGCNMYASFVRKGWIKGQKNQNCPDGNCEW